jgi:hypothetical protein
MPTRDDLLKCGLDPKAFVLYLRFYSLMGADVYVARLTRNLVFVLDYVKATETKFGNAAYFQ